MLDPTHRHRHTQPSQLRAQDDSWRAQIFHTSQVGHDKGIAIGASMLESTFEGQGSLSTLLTRLWSHAGPERCI